jgi:hypothetical protein
MYPLPIKYVYKILLKNQIILTGWYNVELEALLLLLLLVFADTV